MSDLHSPYLTLKFANALYKATPESLDAEQRTKVAAAVSRASALEDCILASREAASVVVPEEAINHSLAEIAKRFQDAAELDEELAQQALTPHTLRAAVEHDLRVEAVLETVSARIPAVTSEEVEIFYLLHRERFRTPARRTMRHILITLNEDFASNTREAATARIAEIHAQCRAHPDQFAALAERHSECPTALQGGLLGCIQRGQLYPSLDTAAFALRPGNISAPQESPIGFHILRCESVEPATIIPLAVAQERIRAHMTRVRQSARQREWITELTQTTPRLA